MPPLFARLFRSDLRWNMYSETARIVTRSEGWRLRWIVLAVAIPLFGVVAAFGTVQDAPEPVATRTVVEALALSVASLGEPWTDVYFHEERFRSDDTLATLLERLGADSGEAARFLRSSQAVRSFRLLRPGTAVQARISEDGTLRSLSFLTSRDTLVSIDRLGEGFGTSEQQIELVHEIAMRSGEISSSLFGATDAAGIPDSVAIQLADIFAGEIDFHRDLRRGDRFTVVFGTIYQSGSVTRPGRVLAAEFTSQKRTYRAVWFEGPWGKGGYYTPEGKNLRKAFLRSPLEFSRITSGFGMRHHPIFQQWRAHRGVDYGAPIGTRVKATGDGVVEFAGQRNGYGNLVVLRHHGGYSTYYAHLKGFARSLKRGGRVAQGDVIGYVGQTGWATGAHLHYEFRVHDQYRNPLTMIFPAALPIAADELATFKRAAEPLAARLDLLKNSNLAQLE
jgi:murein DD-endopeptidase MepM/ murein hydrolase activator NlpD